MTDAELNRKLALALGYAPENMGMEGAGRSFMVRGTWDGYTYEYCRKFDYRDPTVVVPLIKWLTRTYGGFFTRDVIGPHQVWYLPRCFPSMPDRSYPTLEEAVCKAVIAVKGKP